MWHCVLCILCVQSSSFPMYESSAGRRPAKPKPLACCVESYRDRETDRNIPFSVLPSHLVAPTKRLHPTPISGNLQQNSEPAALTYGV